MQMWSSVALLVLLGIYKGVAQTTAPQACYIDICIVMDRSLGLETDWTAQQEFTAMLAEYLMIGSLDSNAQLGVVSYHTSGLSDIFLNDHVNLTDLQDDIRSLSYSPATGFAIDLGLNKARTECLSTDNGARPDATKYVLVITNSPGPSTTIDEADNLRSIGATVLAVGVEAHDPDFTLEIAGGITENVYAYVNFLELQESTDNFLISRKICPEHIRMEFPVLNGPPKLIGPIITPDKTDYYFECVIDYVEEPNALYNVSFLFYGEDSGLPTIIMQYPDTVATIYSSQLEPTELSCQVVSYWDGNFMIPSLPLGSESYKTGIEVSHRDIIVSEGDQSSTGGPPLVGRVYIYSTVPILCSPGTDPCRLELQIECPTMILAGQTGTPACQLWLSANDYHNNTDVFVPDRALQIRPKFMEYLTSPRREATIEFNINSQSPAYTELWSSYKPDRVDVVVRGGILTLGQCLSTGDPHYTTFDDKYYSIIVDGIFDVIRFPGHNVFVQASHHIHGNGNAVNCGIVVQSYNMSITDDPSYNGEKHIIERCDGAALQVVKCQQGEESQTMTHTGNKYEITTAMGDMKVIVTDQGTFFNLEIQALTDHFYGLDPDGYPHITGTCGTYDGDKSNDHEPSEDANDVPCTNLECFTEWAMVKEAEFEPNRFDCGAPVDLLPAATSFCSCQNGNPQCTSGNLRGSGTLMENIPIPIEVLESGNLRSSNSPYYTDDIIYDYQPPVAVTPPFRDATPPEWGTFNVTEVQATAACNTSYEEAPFSGICGMYITAQNLDTYMYGCTRDIQYTGDLGWAAFHVSNLLSSCQHNIKKSLNLTDAEHPATDPVFNETMGGFLNTTCLNQCSGNGYCNMGSCVCNTGYTKEDCSLHISTPPHPIKYKDPAVCDVLSRPCTSANIRADDIGNTPTLSCKVKMHLTNGTLLEMIFPATLSTPESIRCSLPNLRDFGSETHPVLYSYETHISNDGNNFAKVNSSEQRMVWHSNWIWIECVLSGDYLPKLESCVIESQCYAEDEMRDGVDPCYGCYPDKDPHQWTPEEVIDEDTNLSPWTRYSNCNKECDYGQSSRTRECTGGCCGYGELHEALLCNTYNCEELPIEQHEGVVITVAGMAMDEIVVSEVDIQRMSTELLNDYTKNNPSDFCAALGLVPLSTPTEVLGILSPNDTRTADGYPKYISDTTTSLKLITEVGRSSVDDLCQIASETSMGSHQTWFVDSDYMMAALVELDALFKQAWGPDVGVDLSSPEEVISTGPNITIIMATVIPIACLLLAVAIAIPLVVKKKKRFNYSGEESTNKTQQHDQKIPMETIQRPLSAKSFHNRVSPEPEDDIITTSDD